MIMGRSIARLAVLSGALFLGVGGAETRVAADGPPADGGAATSAQSPAGANGAAMYRDAFAMLGWGTGQPILSADDVDFMDNLSYPIEPDQRGRLERLMTVTEAARARLDAGARARTVDWGLERGEGFAMLLPHLGHMRGAARLQRLAILAQLDAGRKDEALQSMMSMGLMGPQLGSDHVTVSSLTGSAIGGRLFTETAHLVIDSGAVGQDEAKALLEALRPLKGEDPFRYADAVMGEWSMMDEAMRGPNAAQQLGLAADSLAGTDTREAQALRALTPEAAREQVAALKGTFERASAAFANPDPQAARAEIARIERMAESGRLGTLAKALMPSLGNVYESKLRSAQELAILLGRLEAIAAGTMAREEVLNAALLLARASAGARSLLREDQESVEMLRVAPAALDGARRDRAADVLKRADDGVFKPLGEAIRCSTCDFTVLRNRSDFPSLDVRLLGGVRGAVRMALTEALVRVRASHDPQRVVPAAVVGFRVAALLSTQPSFARATAAQAIWRETAAAVTEAAGEGALPKDSVDELQRAMATMPTDDPFGFRRAVDREAARVLRSRMPWLRQSPREREEARARESGRGGAGGVAGGRAGGSAGDAGSDAGAARMLEPLVQVLRSRGPSAVFALAAWCAQDAEDAHVDDEPGTLVAVTDLFPAEGMAAVRAAHERSRGEDARDDPFERDLPVEDVRARLRRWDPVRGVQFVDGGQRMAAAVADYMAGIEAVRAAGARPPVSE